MNCDELTAALEKTLIRERDSRWLDEARRHAEGCPSCARLLELHQLEEDLADLPAIEPSGLLLEAVMSRIAQRESAAVPSRGFSHEWLRYAIITAGALLLATAYLFPAAGESWLSNLRPATELVRTSGISAYLSQHPLWAIHLAGFAALLIVLGIAAGTEGPVREFVRRHSSSGDSPCVPA
jgi:hypothetical protein